MPQLESNPQPMYGNRARNLLEYRMMLPPTSTPARANSISKNRSNQVTALINPNKKFLKVFTKTSRWHPSNYMIYSYTVCVSVITSYSFIRDYVSVYASRPTHMGKSPSSCQTFHLREALRVQASHL